MDKVQNLDIRVKALELSDESQDEGLELLVQSLEHFGNAMRLMLKDIEDLQKKLDSITSVSPKLTDLN